jgi:hypothetical protein
VEPSARPVRPASPITRSAAPTPQPIAQQPIAPEPSPAPAPPVAAEPLELPAPPAAVTGDLQIIDADPKAVVMNSDSGITESITITEPPAPRQPPASAEINVIVPEPDLIEEISPISKPAIEIRIDSAVAMCGICQSRINVGEEMTSCRECALTFHADCWSENRGCAAYGCPQVGVLEPPDANPVKQLDESEFVDPFPWEFLLLGAGVVSIVAGALAFGVPSALLGVLTIWGGLRKGFRRWPLLAACFTLAVVGLVVGLEFSKFWWLGWKPFEWVMR